MQRTNAGVQEKCRISKPKFSGEIKDKAKNIYLIIDSWSCWRVPSDTLACLAVYIAGINKHSCILLALKLTQDVKHGCSITC